MATPKKKAAKSTKSPAPKKPIDDDNDHDESEVSDESLEKVVGGAKPATKLVGGRPVGKKIA